MTGCFPGVSAYICSWMLAARRCLIREPKIADPMCHVFQMSPATQQMQPTQTLQSPPPSGGRRRRVVDEDPDERRRKFLERNRAAATRCRQKRKVWVMSLEKKAEELTQTNMQLQVQTITLGASKSISHNTLTHCYFDLLIMSHFTTEIQK